MVFTSRAVRESEQFRCAEKGSGEEPSISVTGSVLLSQRINT